VTGISNVIFICKQQALMERVALQISLAGTLLSHFQSL